MRGTKTKPHAGEVKPAWGLWTPKQSTISAPKLPPSLAFDKQRRGEGHANQKKSSPPMVKQRWNDMSQQERDEYARQDEVNAKPCEIPASDRLELLLYKFGAISELFQSGGYLPESCQLWNQVDPLALECLRLYYGEGMTYAQIAQSLSVQYISGNKVLKSSKLSRYAVHKLLRSGRESLIALYRDGGFSNGSEKVHRSAG